MACCKTREPPFNEVIDSLELSLPQKNILKERYVSLVDQMCRRAYRISIVYHVSHAIVTVGSLVVPALLSIQYMTAENQIYWVTWVTSLLVTTCNGLLSLFKIDKKYMFLHTNKEHIISEGWQYAGLSGRYSGFYTPGKDATHANQYIFFCHVIEKIRMREVENEYYQIQEAGTTPEGGKQTTNTRPNPIIPITPLNPLQSGPRLNTILEEAGESPTPLVDGGTRPPGEVSVPIRV